MNFEVNKLLQIEYLNDLVSQLNVDIKRINDSFLEQYNLDKFKEMSFEDVNVMFNKHDVNNESLLLYLESDFIDDEWEFADIFSDDISYSTELREDIKNKALLEINELNSKINIINEGYNHELNEFQKKLGFVEEIMNILTNDILSEEDIDTIKLLIINSDLSEEDKFVLSCDLVRHLIEKKKHVLVSEKTEFDTSSFEQELDNIYIGVDYNEEESYDFTGELVYSETILGYYKFYKTLFDNVGLGYDLEEVMNNAYSLVSGINPSNNSMDKEDFCIKLGALLYQLNDVQKNDKSNQEAIADILMDLAVLDRLYEENEQYSEEKKNILENIKNQLTVVLTVNVPGLVSDKVKNKLSLLQIELKNNLINSKRKHELDLEYKNVQKEMSLILKAIKQLSRVEKINNDVVKLLKNGYSVNVTVSNDYYNGLSDLQEIVLELKNRIINSEFNLENDKEIIKLEEELSKYIIDSTSKEEKTTLKGFVLFDFDEDNKPYVIRDLDPNNNKSLIDESVLKGEIVSGYEDYNSLINDLLIYATPLVLKNGGQSVIEKILQKVFYDKERKHPTKMVRIRPLRNSLVRFVSQKVSLISGTEIHKQVSDVIQKVLPNVEIDKNEDFDIYINYSSAMKAIDEDSYDEAINRYSRQSPLYKLFVNHSEKDKLTNEECKLLEDIIHMTLEAYSTLENKNENLKFDIVRQIGGKKTRG